MFEAIEILRIWSLQFLAARENKRRVWDIYLYNLMKYKGFVVRAKLFALENTC